MLSSRIFRLSVLEANALEIPNKIRGPVLPLI